MVTVGEAPVKVPFITVDGLSGVPVGPDGRVELAVIGEPEGVEEPVPARGAPL